MLVLCAPDDFKGTLHAAEAAAALAQGVRDAGHEAVEFPVADGGEGTARLLKQAKGGVLQSAHVTDPLGRPLETSWVLLPDGTAVVESAAASGLWYLAAGDRRPMNASSFGTGQLLAEALNQGATKLVLCIGGTATVDGGCGLLQALGVTLHADDGPLRQHCCPTDLQTLTAVDPPASFPPITGLVDTMVPLLGKAGAARMFAPQKGASAAQVEQLESTMQRIAEVLDPQSQHRDTPGAGSGGGMGFAVCTMGGTLLRGGDAVLEMLGINDALQNIDLVLTGEGCMNAQTATGKAPAAVAAAAASAGIECIGIGGRLEAGADDLLADGTFVALDSLADRCGLERAMHEPASCLRESAKAMLQQH